MRKNISLVLPMGMFVCVTVVEPGQVSQAPALVNKTGGHGIGLILEPPARRWSAN